MIEQYLTEEEMRGCLAAGASSVLEKSAMEKDAFWPWLGAALAAAKTGIKGVLGIGTGVAKSGVELVKEYLQALAWAGGAGAATGALGGTAYNIIKERMQREDPEESFNNRLEALYANRSRELSDAKWMTRVRSMRDDLKRNYKKMTPDEYRAQYNALVDALDERSV